jgi:hypothetical protein
MDLSIENLKKSKAFTSKPVKKEIEWVSDGVTHKFNTYVRPLSYQTAIGDINARNGVDFLASRIASSLCDQDGKAVFTVSDLTGQDDPERGAIDPVLTQLLLVAIHEVQNAGKIPASTK